MTIVQKSKRLFRAYLADEKGLSAVEYGLLAAGIAIGLYVILAGIGVDLRTVFTSVKTDLDTAAGGGG